MWWSLTILLYPETLTLLQKSNISLKKKQKIGDVEPIKEDNIISQILRHMWYNRSIKQFVTRKELYKPLFLITYLTIIQQLTGMTIIRSYVVKIFNTLGKKEKQWGINMPYFSTFFRYIFLYISFSMLTCQLKYIEAAGVSVRPQNFVVVN